MFHDMDKLNGRFSIYHHPCMIHEAGINDSWLNLDLEHRYEGTRIGTSLYAACLLYTSFARSAATQPLIPPAVTPSTKYSCAKKYRRIGGTIEIRDMAIT